MRIVAANIRAGGGRRMAHLASLIRIHEPDVVALSEARLSTQVAELGDPEWICEPTELVKQNGAALLAAGLVPVPVDPGGVDNFVVAGEVGGWLIVSVYLPVSGTGRKAAAWEALLNIAREFSDRPAVIVGDLNTGSDPDRLSPVPLECEAEFEALSADLGWTDVWRFDNPDTPTEFTWVNHRGSGYRLDHAFISPAGMERSPNPSCFYAHGFRHENAATDHSAVVLDV